MNHAAPWDPFWVAQMVTSHHRLLGTQLAGPSAVGASASDLEWLYERAPFCLLAHDGGSDPRFVYANRTAQRCFEYGWDEFVGLPSRLSALPDGRAERAVLLASVARDGFARGYRGLRVAKSGRRFWIEDVTVWNVFDPEGRPIGQAAVYERTTAC